MKSENGLNCALFSTSFEPIGMNPFHYKLSTNNNDK